MISSRIHYSSDRKITAEQFADILNRSTLGDRRPVNDMARIQRMLDHANILITAWDGNRIVGVSRALSDFAFCCYLSDLAVDVAYQHHGIGKRLVAETAQVAGVESSTILQAAPAAVDYYPKIGMERADHCFVIKRKK